MWGKCVMELARESDLAKNVAARMAAESLMDLAREEGQKHGSRYWLLLAGMIDVHLPKPTEKVEKTKKAPMTAMEAKRFGKRTIPFGQFVGKMIDDVPLERLQWYADQTFVDDLRRYLESDRVGREGDG